MELAYELGRTEQEIEQFTPDEFGRWIAFFQLVHERDKKNAKMRGKK